MSTGGDPRGGRLGLSQSLYAGRGGRLGVSGVPTLPAGRMVLTGRVGAYGGIQFEVGGCSVFTALGLGRAIGVRGNRGKEAKSAL